MGYWSFGDYFKEQSINQLYDFFTKELGLDPEKLYITCFEGDDDAPKDTEAAEIWKSLGIPEERIYFMGKESNWWKVGDTGPCGPDTEVFYDISGEVLNLKSKEEFEKADDDQKIVEIANSVFMQYEMKDGKVIGELPQKNVDMGSGFERVVMAVQGKDNIFETDLFYGVMSVAVEISDDLTSQRIISDHLRTAVLLISDRVKPSNTEQGYILRRLLRRAIFNSNNKEIPEELLEKIVTSIKQKYNGVYKIDSGQVLEIIKKEQESFKKTLHQGLREFEKKTENISGRDAFVLFTTYGFPFELTKELANERGVVVDEEGFKREMVEHQGKFKGGLKDTNPKTIAYHTATHLLHEALRRVLGDHVRQRGSNITSERLRFDFSHPQKMTNEEKQKVEDIVNDIIKKDLHVYCDEMSTDEAFTSGALGEFGVKYGETVMVYSVGKGEDRFSYEICGGPHVEKTGNIGVFKIKKEEASSAGVRRIKAILN